MKTPPIIDDETKKLSESLIDEMVTAIGLPKKPFYHTIFWHLLRNITDRLAYLGVTFNRIIGEDGLPAGSAWGLTHFCNPARVIGKEQIPQEGPLLVVSNHPGAYDALVAFSQFTRKDIKWISSEIPFLRQLPHASEHIIFSSKDDSQTRMIVFRDAIRHLKSGGVLFYMGAGHREPDPAVYPGAKASINAWLNVYDAFYKYVPELKVLPVIMSGMILPKWVKSPLTWLRRKQIDKQRLSEFGQVIHQLLRPGKVMVTPNISFGIPYLQADLQGEMINDSILPAAIQRSQVLLQDHTRLFELPGFD